jgi:CBS-domain-containing membrane protein
MANWFTSGHAVDCILAAMALEVMVLIIIHKQFGRGIKPWDLIASVLAGTALLFALRAALTAQPWSVVAACLSLALPAHLWDLARRWSAA